MSFNRGNMTKKIYNNDWNELKDIKKRNKKFITYGIHAFTIRESISINNETIYQCIENNDLKTHCYFIKREDNVYYNLFEYLNYSRPLFREKIKSLDSLFSNKKNIDNF
jgi:hypothetical protein